MGIKNKAQIITFDLVISIVIFLIFIAIFSSLVFSSRKKAWDIFVEEGLPVFRNIREAVGALSRVCWYIEVKESRRKVS